MPELSTSVKPTTLAEAFTSLGPYPEDHPQTMRELLDADPDTISHPLALFLRKQALEVKRGAEKHYINGPEDALALLANGYVLHPWTGGWTSYALAENRQVITEDHPRGGRRPLRRNTALLPKRDDLPPLPRGLGKGVKQPAWLVLYGGEPAVLSKPGVAKGLATLASRTNLADVMFYHCDPEGHVPPTLWSIRAGCGMEANGAPGGRRVEFPDMDAMNVVRTEVRRAA